MLLTPEQVDLQPSEELRPLLKALLEDFESLRQRVASLEAENERLKQQLTGSTNSRNSSQPPSRDQKTNPPRTNRRRSTARLSVIRSFRARW
jgi:cell division septum initiation protein DivIVA